MRVLYVLLTEADRRASERRHKVDGAKGAGKLGAVVAIPPFWDD